MPHILPGIMSLIQYKNDIEHQLQKKIVQSELIDAAPVNMYPR
jgi:hypothetical protein